MTYSTHECDVLVLGGGLAAMRAAIEAKLAGRDVVMLNRGQIGRSGSSALTGTGFAAVFPELVPQDSLATHLGDTIRGGAYVNDLGLAQVLVEEAPAPFLGSEQVEALYEASKAILRLAGYVGAGTCVWDRCVLECGVKLIF